MGVRILHDTEQNQACLFCSTSDFAFGPVFTADDEKGHSAYERAEAFLRWIDAHPVENATTRLLGRFDVRHMDEQQMSLSYGHWLVQEPAQWKAEEDAADIAAQA